MNTPAREAKDCSRYHAPGRPTQPVVRQEPQDDRHDHLHAHLTQGIKAADFLGSDRPIRHLSPLVPGSLPARKSIARTGLAAGVFSEPPTESQPAVREIFHKLCRVQAGNAAASARLSERLTTAGNVPFWRASN